MQLDRWREPKPPAMIALAGWLDSWAGLGAVVAGMAAQGCDLQLTEYAGANWRATFFLTGMAHSIVRGSAYSPASAAEKLVLAFLDEQWPSGSPKPPPTTFSQYTLSETAKKILFP